MLRLGLFSKEMYCTLQEAYQLPSFDPTAKKMKRTTMSCAPSQDQTLYGYNPNTDRKEQARYVQENFEGTLGPEPTYQNRKNDYKYYCDNYRVCSNKVQEDFEDMSKSNVFKKAPAPLPRTQEQCGPLQPPMYDIPVSDEAKKQYKRAFDVAMEQPEQAMHVPAPAKMRQVDMSNVSGYDDEDFEMYLQTKDMKSASMPSISSMQRRSSNPSSRDFAEAMDDFQGKLTPAVSSSKTPAYMEDVEDTSTTYQGIRRKPVVDRWSQWMDILLFFLAGVLVIFLCDQLIRLGIMMGMRQTIETLKPILESIETKLK